jgi:hypothetical protein
VSALKRAEQDVARGDLGSARRRMASFVVSADYEPDVLARLGDVCRAMGDPVEAGRWYLLSSADGPEVDEAVGRFVAACRGVPSHVAAALPHFRRRWDVGIYAGSARARVDRYGLVACFHGEAQRRNPRDARRAGRLAALGCIAGVLAFGGVIVAGVVTILRLLDRLL